MALSVGRMRGGGYEYLYLPSPLLTKEGKGGAGIVNKLLNTYKDDRKERNAGFRPRTARSFCFGKRTQNHWRPGVALRVPLPRSRKVWAAELASLKQSSPPTRVRDWGAAAPAGAGEWRHEVARVGMPLPPLAPPYKGGERRDKIARVGMETATTLDSSTHLDWSIF